MGCRENIVRTVKSVRLVWSRKEMNADKTLVRKPHVKCPFQKPRKWAHNIKTEINFEAGK
jgi:hypothetical protein